MKVLSKIRQSLCSHNLKITITKIDDTIAAPDGYRWVWWRCDMCGRTNVSLMRIQAKHVYPKKDTFETCGKNADCVVIDYFPEDFQPDPELNMFKENLHKTS